jgi:hypothetical protein
LDAEEDPIIIVDVNSYNMGVGTSVGCSNIGVSVGVGSSSVGVGSSSISANKDEWIIIL